jgi:thiol-disulfide isomerase/thioredoxin
MRSYDSLEAKAALDVSLYAGDKSQSGNFDSATLKEFNKALQNLNRKDLKFVLANGSSYYAFWFFRRNLLFLNFITPDSLLHIFKTIFPPNFKNSREGVVIREILSGRVSVREGKEAPDFISKDINGKAVSLANFRDQKYVLITFWATWCGPCIAEMPILRSIRDKYPAQYLEIISICYPSSSTAALKVIRENKMDWINIYNDIDLVSVYGGYRPIPCIYLVDKSGKIIYSGKNDDSQLTKLKSILENGLVK